jgi:hypothetical protein
MFLSHLPGFYSYIGIGCILKIVIQLNDKIKTTKGTTTKSATKTTKAHG